MIVKISTFGGFCWGVRRAIRIAEKTLAEHNRYPIYTLGPLIHNDQVIQMLSSKGIKILDKPSYQKNPNNTILIICAHGITPKKYEELKKYNYCIVDATCPHVAKSQKIVREYSDKNYHIIIAGDKKHAEVISLKGFAKEASVVSSALSAKLLKIPPHRPVFLIAQSTFNKDTFCQIQDILNKKYKDRLIVFNSICSATIRTQEELKKLCREVEAVIVIGSRNSANTNRLEEIVIASGLTCFRIETEQELPLSKLKDFEQIGITAGASTPEWIINNTINKLKENFNLKIQKLNEPDSSFVEGKLPD